MSESISLPDEYRRMLLDIAAAIGATSDELSAAKYESRSPEQVVPIMR